MLLKARGGADDGYDMTGLLRWTVINLQQTDYLWERRIAALEMLGTPALLCQRSSPRPEPVQLPLASDNQVSAHGLLNGYTKKMPAADHVPAASSFEPVGCRPCSSTPFGEPFNLPLDTDPQADLPPSGVKEPAAPVPRTEVGNVAGRFRRGAGCPYTLPIVR